MKTEVMFGALLRAATAAAAAAATPSSVGGCCTRRRLPSSANLASQLRFISAAAVHVVDKALRSAQFNHS